MKIGEILIPPEIVEKILFKHGIRPSEVETVLRQQFGKTYFETVRGNRYMAIGKCVRGYLTIFFDYSGGDAEVVTSRFSGTGEKRKYRRKLAGDMYDWL